MPRAGRRGGTDGRRAEGTRWRRRSPVAPRVTGHRDYVIKVLLHGLTGRSRTRSIPAA